MPEGTNASAQTYSSIRPDAYSLYGRGNAPQRKIVQNQEPKPDENMLNVKTPQQLYQAKASLLQQQLQQQQAYAQNATMRGQERLQQQLAEARKGYMSGLQATQEQGFQRGRGMLNQLSNRGLATSGLLQLGDIQNRMATGRALSALGEQLNQAQMGAQEASRGLEESLQQGLMQTGREYRLGMQEADEQLYGRTRQADQDLLQAKLALTELGLDPNTTPEILENARQAYSAYLGQDLDGVTQPASALLEQLGNYGTKTFNEQIDWRWSSSPMDGMRDLLSAILGVKPAEGKYTYTLPGDVQRSYSNPEEFISVLKDYYKGMPGYQNIDIKANPQGSIRFYVNGQEYKTFNKAYEAYRVKQ